MTANQAYRRLALILLIFSGLSLAHSLLIPLHGKVPDEIAHFQYSRYLARHHWLPTNYEERDEAGFISFWPPLYHIVVATFTAWSDSDQPPYLKFVWESPRFGMARELLDTKRLANTEDEQWPYQGTILMWHLGRGVSILLSGCTIVLAFMTTLQLWPGNYRLATISAALLGMIPAFVFISSVMSYETLLGVLVGLYFLRLIKIINGDDSIKSYLLLGLWMGLSVTTKYTTAVLPLQVMGVIGYLAWQCGWGWLGWFRRVLTTAIASMLASSWWFVFLVIYFNEIDKLGWFFGSLKPILSDGIDTSQNYIAYVVTGGTLGEHESLEMTAAPFSGWLIRIYQTFWTGGIGYTNFIGWPSAHALMGGVCLLATIGLGRAWWYHPERRLWIGLLVSHALLLLILPITMFMIQGNIPWTAQGRHVLFPLATALPLLMIDGWQTWLSSKTQRYFALLILTGLLSWTLAQTIIITDYYTPLLPIRTTPDVPMAHKTDKQFGDTLTLLGYDLYPAPDKIRLSLYWHSPTYVDEDYQVDLTLVQDGEPRLHWAAYPLNGRYPTRIWESWETIRDTFTLPTDDLPTGDYTVTLQLRGVHGPLLVDGRESLTVTTFTLAETAPAEPEIPFYLTAGNQTVVSGLTLWQAEDYQQLKLPTYRPRMAIPFVWHGQLPSTLRLQWLLVGNQGQIYPSLSASPHFEYFMVGLDWPSGDYRLRAELWDDKQVVASQESGPLLTIFNERPRQLQPLTMGHTLSANFANRINLLGYDLPNRTLTSPQGIPLTLYWQGLRTMGRSYTVFTKLFDQHHQLWSSVERLPADGYNTIYWLEGERVTDSFELPIEPDTPPGIYWLNVGLYEEINQTAISLPLVVDGVSSEITSMTLGPIKIGPTPPELLLSPQAAQGDNPLSVQFGEPPLIALNGYDLTQAKEILQLKLYWQSLAPTQTDWSFFIHATNQTGDIIAQKDGLLGGGRYPTGLWDVGEIISDAVELRLPSQAEYALTVGVYRLDTGERLPLQGTSYDHLRLPHD